MRKIVSFSISVLSAVCFVCAAPGIDEDFYLNNKSLDDKSAVCVSKILPNTLRLNLSEGEEGELYADVLPDDAGDKSLSWSLPQRLGKVEIYPAGKSCTIVGVLSGEETVKISSANGVTAEISVFVKENPKTKVRSFEIDEEETPRRNLSAIFLRVAAGSLITLGTMLTAGAVFLMIIRGEWRRKE